MPKRKKEKLPETDTKVAVFQSKQIRKTIHNNEWWFSVVDVISALTNSTNPRDYWYKMKIREKAESGAELSTICRQLKLESPDGKKYKTDCANTEGIFRIIQSIPSPKAEPFKRWLAKVGYEHVQEIENPELAVQRIRAIYRAKGYSDEWIENRMKSIDMRKKLTDEWLSRGIIENKEFSILTAEISKAAFGFTPEEYKQHKKLEKPSDNLRDHMTDLELIFTMLGEASTTEIAKTKDAQGFKQNKKAAREGGDVSGGARKQLEKKTGRKVVSAVNYKEIPERKMRKFLK